MGLVIPCHVRFVLTGGNWSVRLVLVAFNIVASTISEARDRYPLSKTIRKKGIVGSSNKGNSKC